MEALIMPQLQELLRILEAKYGVRGEHDLPTEDAMRWYIRCTFPEAFRK